MSSSEYGNFAAYLAGKINTEGGGGSTPPEDIADGIDASVDIDSILTQLQTIAASFPSPPYLTQDLVSGDWTTVTIAASSTTSSAFAMTGRLNYMAISAATGTPVLTLQAQNYDNSWFDTSVTATLGASVVTIESDTLANVAGLCGIANFRFSLSTTDASTITVAIASRDGVNAD